MLEERYALLSKLQSNGLRAMAHVLSRKGGDDSTYFDCVIGNRLTFEALKKYADAPEPVVQYIKEQSVSEQCHCKIFPAERSEIAERIAQFHLGIISRRGWPSFLSCMPLLGERMALATSFAIKNTAQEDRSSHTTDKGFLDEFWHCSAPLVLLALYATDQELETACEDQESFIKAMKVPDEIYDATQPARCVLAGRQAHSV
jgi:hypothetical protein